MSAAARFVIAPIAAANLPQLATLHLTAFPGSESTLLGEHYATALLDWFRCCDDAVALAATADGAAIGYVLGAWQTDLGRLYRTLLPVTLRCLLDRPFVLVDARVRQMAVLRARLLLRRGGREPSALRPRCMVLKTIAVADAWRCHGVGSALLAAFTQEAVRRHVSRLTLSVRRTNATARSFYEHRSWHPVGRGDDEFIEYQTVVAADAAA